MRAALAFIAFLGLLQAGCGGCTASNTAATPSPTPVPTFPGSRNLEKARNEAAAGNLSTASDALSEAQRELEEAAPLRVLSLEIVQLPVTGYGIYKEVPGAALSISKKDPLNLYFEANGFGRRNANGLWTPDLSASVALYAPQVGPTPFVQQASFVNTTFDSHRPNRELYNVATLHVTGVPAGTYVAEITLTDKVTGKTAKATTPFTLVP